MKGMIPWIQEKIIILQTEKPRKHIMHNRFTISQSSTIDML